ncbi:MAG: hypothetical protein M3345_05520 [Actinomycetota bacterium]|nr:hypothetical protein [Actinomycetota bacterium]
MTTPPPTGPQLEDHHAEEEPVIVGRDSSFWARDGALKVGEVPAGAVNINVTGKRLASPMQGFGKLWQKTYTVALDGAEVTPQEVISAWKSRFSEFWPPKNSFYGPLAGIAPGETALLNLSVGGPMKLSTGVFVMYADDESFAFMNPQGHMFSGMITFSAEDRRGTTIVKVQPLVRASDPIYEIGMPLLMAKREDQFWQETLANVAAHFGVHGVPVKTEAVVLDKKRQWKNAKNV